MVTTDNEAKYIIGGNLPTVIDHNLLIKKVTYMCSGRDDGQVFCVENAFTLYSQLNDRAVPDSSWFLFVIESQSCGHCDSKYNIKYA